MLEYLSTDQNIVLLDLVKVDFAVRTRVLFVAMSCQEGGPARVNHPTLVSWPATRLPSQEQRKIAW